MCDCLSQLFWCVGFGHTFGCWFGHWILVVCLVIGSKSSLARKIKYSFGFSAKLVALCVCVKSSA